MHMRTRTCVHTCVRAHTCMHTHMCCYVLCMCAVCCVSHVHSVWCGVCVWFFTRAPHSSGLGQLHPSCGPHLTIPELPQTPGLGCLRGGLPVTPPPPAQVSSPPGDQHIHDPGGWARPGVSGVRKGVPAQLITPDGGEKQLAGRSCWPDPGLPQVRAAACPGSGALASGGGGHMPLVDSRWPGQGPGSCGWSSPRHTSASAWSHGPTPPPCPESVSPSVLTLG